MAIEKERKFVIENSARVFREMLALNPIDEEIEQHYIKGIEDTITRIRRSCVTDGEDQYWLCFKYNTKGLDKSSINEEEFSISEDFFEYLKTKTSYGIRKDRLTCTLGNILIVGDSYPIYLGLPLVVEVEMCNPTQSWDEVEIPQWILNNGTEVTGDRNWSNVALAKKASNYVESE